MDFGFNDAPHNWTPETIRKAKKAGSTVIRLPVAVSVLKTQGYAPYDPIFKEAKRQGLKVIPHIADDRKQSIGAVKRASRKTAKRYGKTVGAIEVWNEPNLIGAMPAKRYGRMLKKTTKAVKKARPKLDVIAAATSPSKKGERQYLRKAIKKAGNADFDMNVHIYPSGNVKKAVKRSVRYARKVGDGRDVWASEVGAAADRYSDQGRASKQLYKALQREKVKGAIFHRLVQPPAGQGPPGPDGSANWEDRSRLGALDESGKETAIYRALKQARRKRKR